MIKKLLKATKAFNKIKILKAKRTQRYLLSLMKKIKANRDKLVFTTINKLLLNKKLLKGFSSVEQLRSKHK